MFFYEVDDRKKETLQTLIKLMLKKGSNVVSDMWRVYIRLEQKGHRYHTVYHKFNFVNPHIGKYT